MLVIRKTRLIGRKIGRVYTTSSTYMLTCRNCTSGLKGGDFQNLC